MRIITRSITQKRLNLMHPQVFKDTLLNALEHSVKPHIMADFESTVATWNRKVDFDYEIRAGNSITLDVFATGDRAWVYEQINDGTPGRVITTTKKWPMKFHVGYQAATSPGFVGSRAAVRFGRVVRARAVGVQKPHSITARHFDEAIADRNIDLARRQIENAIRRAIRASQGLV